MKLNKSHIYISLALYSVIILLILFVNSKISKKFTLKNPSQKKITEKKSITIKPNNRKKININPLYDPLAPMKNSNKKKKTSTKENYTTEKLNLKNSTMKSSEVPLDSIIMTQ